MVKVTWHAPVLKPDNTVVAFPKKLLLLQRPWGDSWAKFEPADGDSCLLPRIMTSGGTISEQGALVIMRGEELAKEGLETYMTMGANKGLEVIKDVVEDNK
jgi:hypothetical protein